MVFKSDRRWSPGPFFDVEAFNSIADAIFRFADYDGPFARNHVWRFFMDPVRRSLYTEWSLLAWITVEHLRLVYGKNLGHTYLESLVQSLSEGSDEFRSL